jgi:hypothetical protein
MRPLNTFLILLLFGATLSAQTARVQVIHNSADAAADTVDVWLNNTLLLDNFAFRNASPFVSAPAGVPIEIRIKDKASTDTTNPIALFTFTLAANETYVVVADGIVSPTGYNPATPFDLKVYGMGRETASNASNTDVLVHHGSTDAPVVDVVEVGAVGATLIDDMAYGEFRGYLELPTADYRIQIRDASGTVAVAEYLAPLATLNAQGAALVVVASGFLDPANNSNGPAFGLYAALPTGGELLELPGATLSVARAQIIHNSADAAAAEVDVWLNEVKLVPGFKFREATPFVDLPAGAPLDVALTGPNSTDPSGAAFAAALTPEAGKTYIIVANGILSGTGYNPSQPFNLYLYDMGRESADNPGNTDVLVFHGATDAPVVDVVETAAGAGTIVDDLAYGDFRGYLELATADYALDIRDETGAVTVASYLAPLSTLNLDDEALVVLASGFLDPSENSNGPAFGLYAALASGGALVALPITTGVGTLPIDGANLYPNPAVSSFDLALSLTATENLSYIITDLQGRIVDAARLGTLSEGAHNFRFSVSNLDAGQYNLTLTGTQGARNFPIQVVR